MKISKKKKKYTCELPPNYPTADYGVIARLCRSLYGLKQAPRAWFEKFRDALLKLNFC